MMTLRLPPDLEARLEHFCSTKDHTKSAAIAAALTQFLNIADLSTLPLTVPVLEDAEERFKRQRDLQQKQYEVEVEISGWISAGAVFTKISDPSGNPGPGVYGRNTVIGFCDTFWDADGNIDDEVYVIAQHHSGRATGIDANHRYVMTYTAWKKCMRLVPQA